MSENGQDVMALAGLRRLVLHAREMLRLNRVRPPSNGFRYESDRWKADQIREYGAAMLAEHVLTLVADCLPASDHITADEAAERDRRHAAALSTAQADATAKIDALTKESGERLEKIRNLENERDEALQFQMESENEAAEYLEKLDRLARLAKKDVPAVVRLLLDGDVSASESVKEPS